MSRTNSSSGRPRKPRRAERNWLRLVMAVAATALVLPMAACQKQAPTPVDPSKAGAKDTTPAPATTDAEVQTVTYEVSAPSPETQAADNAIVSATTSYAYAVVLFDELLEAGESGDRSSSELAALLAEVEEAFSEAESEVQEAAAALQQELGSNWRDLDLLEAEDLADDSWADAAIDPALLQDDLSVDGAAAGQPAAFAGTPVPSAGETSSLPTVQPPLAFGAEAGDEWMDRVLLPKARDLPGAHLGSLATMMNTDVRAARSLLEAAEDMIEASPGAWHNLKTTAVTTMRVGVKGVGMALTGSAVAMAAPIAGTAAGATVIAAGTIALALQAADMAIEIVKGGASIVEGVDGRTAVGISKGQQFFSGAAFAFSAGATAAQGVAKATGGALAEKATEGFGVSTAKSAVQSLSDFALDQIPDGGYLSIDLGTMGEDGVRNVTATMVPPGETSEQTLQKAAAAGLNPQVDYVETGAQEQNRDSVKQNLGARKNEIRIQKNQETGEFEVVIGDLDISPFEGQYRMAITYPDGGSEETTAVVTLSGNQMTITPANGDPPMSGTFKPDTGRFDASASGVNYTFTFRNEGGQISASGESYSPAVGIGLGYQLTQM